MIKEYIKKIIKTIILIILMLIIFYNFLNINNTKGFIKIFNYKIIVTQEYQEQNGIEENSLMIVKDMKKYQTKDLIMININNSLYFHKIIEIKNSDEYITKGDGNYRPNEEIKIENIEGKVIKQVPRNGKYI